MSYFWGEISGKDGVGFSGVCVLFIFWASLQRGSEGCHHSRSGAPSAKSVKKAGLRTRSRKLSAGPFWGAEIPPPSPGKPNCKPRLGAIHFFPVARCAPLPLALCSVSRGQKASPAPGWIWKGWPTENGTTLKGVDNGGTTERIDQLGSQFGSCWLGVGPAVRHPWPGI